MKKRRLPDDAPAAMLKIHYSPTSIGETVWMELGAAEKLAAGLRKKGHKVKIVQRGTQP
jgi:hypothetical protein